MYVCMYVCILYYIILLWEEDDAKQLYLIPKVSCRQTHNLQPGTSIIKKFTV